MMFLYQVWIIVLICQPGTVKFKSAMINFNQIIGPIEKAIVRWTQHYPLVSPVKSIEDLTNGEVFIYFLRKVTYFQFAQPCTYDYFGQLSLGERISRMKLIGRSIITYYKVEMMRDMGETHFNYVEMCTGNKEEIIRLVIMFMGIIVTSFEILRELDDYIANSDEESVAYMKIMVDYSKKMSEKDHQDSDSPIKKQKRLITRLQILEEQIQFYEEYTKELQGKVERLTEESEKYQRNIVQNDKRAAQMLKRIEQLETNNEQHLKQIGRILSNQELLNAKLAKNRLLADETISKLITDSEKHKEQTIFYKKLVLKYEQVQASNKELLLTNCELEKEIAVLKSKCDKNIDNLHKKEAQLYQLNRINNDLSLENDSLKLKIELIQKSFTNNRSIHFSPEQKSIVMHKPLDLSTTSNRNNFNWFNCKEKQAEEQRMAESLTLTLKSNESFIQNRLNMLGGMQQNKQNNLSMGNIAPSMKQGLNNLIQQRSFDIDIEQVQVLMKLKEERDFEFQFSIQMITEMYGYMQSLRKQLKKYQLKEAKQLDRELIFKQKVKSMFA